MNSDAEMHKLPAFLCDMVYYRVILWQLDIFLLNCLDYKGFEP
jgi:hypothetical protein